MANSKYVRQRPLTPAQQAYFLNLTFPKFRIIAARHELRCVGTLQPSPTSDRYTVEVEYKVPTRPCVRIVQPQLRLASGRTKLPHVFKGNDLCLHLTGEWRPDLKISEYIIPWVSFWLFFYEVWLVTGEWLGGGHEPTTGRNEPI
jgi:hypothetical protein